MEKYYRKYFKNIGFENKNIFAQKYLNVFGNSWKMEEYYRKYFKKYRIFSQKYRPSHVVENFQKYVYKK